MASVTATPEGDQQAPSRLQAWQQAVDTALAQVGQDLDADQVALYDLAFCAAQLSAAGALHRWAQRTEEDQRLVGLDLAYQADVAADISHRLNQRAAGPTTQNNPFPSAGLRFHQGSSCLADGRFRPTAKQHHQQTAGTCP